jgi:hypothetical protein
MANQRHISRSRDLGPIQLGAHCVEVAQHSSGQVGTADLTRDGWMCQLWVLRRHRGNDGAVQVQASSIRGGEAPRPSLYPVCSVAAFRWNRRIPPAPELLRLEKGRWKQKPPLVLASHASHCRRRQPTGREVLCQNSRVNLWIPSPGSPLNLAWTLVNSLFLRKLPNPMFCRNLPILCFVINIHFILRPILCRKKLLTYINPP